MKTAYQMTVLVLALAMVGVGAKAQSGEVGGFSKGLSNPTAGPTPEPMATPADGAKVDNGALPGDSHVRIVRLSDVKGMLALDRKTGHGFEQTMQNMPIVEGERLQTADGYAEVEYEDSSTLRLAPNSRVDFPLLALRSTGAKASTMSVVHGTVYVSTESTKGDEFVLETGATKMVVAPSTHLRLEVNDAKLVMSVFNGSVAVERDGESTVVGKKQTLTLGGGDEMAVAKKVTEGAYDAWDKESNDYHQTYSRANAFAGGGNSFGLSDLNYYGSFINAGGCGQMWQPYLVSSSWSPYSNGLWALYPGAGYSWVSPYPWGWLPYHTGSWGFCQGVGWGWQPGGNFYGLNNIAGGGVLPGGAAGTLVKTGVHSPLRPASLPQAPAAGAARQSLVLANQTPMVFSKETTPGNFVFQRDSAGLGVPRGSLGSLNKISSDVVRHGSASMPVFAAGPGGGIEASSRGASQGPATLRPASAGPSGNSSFSSASRSGGAEPSTGGQATTASRAGGGISQAAPMSSSGGNSSSGGSHGAAASPK